MTAIDRAYAPWNRELAWGVYGVITEEEDGLDLTPIPLS